MKTAEQQNAEDFDLGRLLFDQANTHSAAVRIGIEVANMRHRAIMGAIAKAYTDALACPHAHIPSALGVMLQKVRDSVKDRE